jgi:integrase
MLTDTLIRNSKPSDRALRLYDQHNLYLELSPKGGKYWRYKYRFAGKEKRLSLGVYPQVTLKKAREFRDQIRLQLGNGVDPGEQRKAVKASNVDRTTNSFEVVAREWLAKHGQCWVESHSDRTLRRLERDLFPWLGQKAVNEIAAKDILKCLRRIEDRGAIETAHRALQNCGQVIRYAVATGRADRDPTGDLRGALPPAKENHFSAVTDPKAVGDLLRIIDGYQGTFIVKCALKLAPMVFVRPGELRNAQWADIDLENAEWKYLVSKTKSLHIVPLSNQALSILKEVFPLTGASRFVFPSARSFDRPMSDNAILSAMRRLGISKEEMTGHGFRATARTILDEVLGFRPDFIEHQLAHAVRDPNGRAYNRTAHLPQRKQMMQAWADYLENLKAEGVILPLKRKEN